MEFVYVVPRATLFPESYPQGLLRFGQDFPRSRFEDALGRGFFVERARAEHTPEWKQVIPYAVVVSEGQVLLLRRLARGGESRLSGKLSIGVGGHIEPGDREEGGAEARALVEAGARRELREEIDVDADAAIRSVGIINDDSNAVGAVHVGLVLVVDARGEVRVREHDILEGRLVAPPELPCLRAEGANFETWSAILVDRLDEILAPPGAPLRTPKPVHLREVACGGESSI